MVQSSGDYFTGFTLYGTFFAAYMVSRISASTWLEVVPSKAGKFEFKLSAKFGFCPKTT